MPQLNPQIDSMRIIRCGLGAETYCLEMSSVDSVGEAALVERFASPTETGQVGTLLSNDESVPVFSLAHRLARPQTHVNAREHLVLLKTSLGRWALLVESVSRVLQIRLDQVHRVPDVVLDQQCKLFKGVIVFPADQQQAETPSAFGEARIRGGREVAEISLLLSPERLHPDARPLEVAHEEQAEEVAAPTPGKPSKAKRRGQVMLLSVTDEPIEKRPCSFGLSLSQILEVVSSLTVIPVPLAPGFVQGLACWRDQPVPVLDLAARFGFKSHIHQQRLVIARARTDGDFVAFPVEAAIRSQRLPMTSIPCPVPLGVREDLMCGAFELESETLMIPDLRRVLTSI